MPGGQPLSQYATDYKQAKGNGGLTEPHERWPCSRPLTIALSASQRGQSIVAPRFVWITTERHRKEGERGATRSPFLAVRIEHVPNRPDLIQLRGYWILSVDEFFSTLCLETRTLLSITQTACRWCLQRIDGDGHLCDFTQVCLRLSRSSPFESLRGVPPSPHHRRTRRYLCVCLSY